ncbi:MAG: hypothetical protein KF861_10935, partial [Planctomycetaceae bacterium]|nr:hypothetical protein [Planctomycetaceae bacterium]
MRILFLQKRLLFPVDTGGKIRTFNIVRHLAEWHDVTYLCNVQPGEETFAKETESLGLRVESVPWHETPRDSWRFLAELAGNLLTTMPYNVAKDYDVPLRKRAQDLLDRDAYDLVICDFVQ